MAAAHHEVSGGRSGAVRTRCAVSTRDCLRATLIAPCSAWSHPATLRPRPLRSGELHPWAQKPEFLSYMAANEIAPIAYSSLVPLSTWRTQDGQASAKTDSMKASSAAFASMAAKYRISEAQLLLRWGVQNGFAVLPKSMNADRMQLNIDLSGFEIDAADLARIKMMDRGHGVAWASGDPSLAE